MSQRVVNVLSFSSYRNLRSKGRLKAPIPRLLRSNEPPSNVEAELVKASILAAEIDASNLEEQLILSSSTNVSIREELALYSEFCAAQRGILSVIRVLPSDILQEIFLRCVDGSEDPRNNKPPFALSQVCVHWRNTALFMPRLWVKIPPIYLTEKKEEITYILFLSEYLRRSGNMPISFHVCSLYKHWINHSALSFLADHSERWDNVSFQISSTTLGNFGFYNDIHGRLASLRRLRLSLWHILLDQNLNMFEIAPKLVDVTVERHYPPSISLPWNQLTVYRNYSYGTGGLTPGGLTSAPNLTILDIVSTEQQLHNTIQPTLSGLKVMKFDFHNPRGSCGSFLTTITAPSLEELRVASYDTRLFPAATLANQVHTLVLRSSCHLRRLAIHEYGQGLSFHDDMMELLRSVPLLEELEVTDLDARSMDSFYHPHLAVLLALKSLVIRVSRQFLLSTGSLNSLGHGRCDPFTEKDIGTVKFSRLEMLCVILTEKCDHLTYQTELEGCNDRTFNPPHGLRNSISNILAEFIFDGELKFQRKSNLNLSLLTRLHKHFCALEKHVGADSRSLQYLYKSRDHVIINQLSQMRRAHDIPGNRKYKFFQRAQALLEKWKNPLKEDLKNRRWMARGKSSLVYVPIDHEMRTSDRALDIVFGMKGTEQDDAYASWPLNGV
ncbi:hypothetical protein BDQ12DRAFT_736994 [Crucibulum laeve]|uniref:F-box domain-containing protein n=1 Tax=Crucibulum laeve TaxID=68775 RepID=A0A5C3LV06_9AGAR|nr:hypothetical protein BDQ12DRAFT_736994 [Crucibulum laeve]